MIRRFWLPPLKLCWIFLQYLGKTELRANDRLVFKTQYKMKFIQKRLS